MARLIDEPTTWGTPRPAVTFPGAAAPPPNVAPNTTTTTPATPPAPPPITVGGSNPNYAELIKGSPGYVAWLASQQSRLGNLATNRAQAIRALALQYGGLPPGFTDAFGDLRPEDLAAASGNPYSAEKVIQHNYEQGVAQMHRALAGRGMLQSGELGFGQQQADYQHGAQESDAANQFLNALNQAVSGYTGGVGDINAEEPGVISSAQSSVEQLYPTVPGSSANYVAGSQEQYGFPVYDDGSGGLWRVGANGPEPFTPSAPPPPAAAPGLRTATPAPASQPTRNIISQPTRVAAINAVATPRPRRP